MAFLEAFPLNFCVHFSYLIPSFMSTDLILIDLVKSNSIWRRMLTLTLLFM
jgi:hypothetical protein